MNYCSDIACFRYEQIIFVSVDEMGKLGSFSNNDDWFEWILFDTICEFGIVLKMEDDGCCIGIWCIVICNYEFVSFYWLIVIQLD